jgi:endo-1,4-beta-D-glucanase Y
VICRRDPLENCWSCFKQFFTSGWEITNDNEQLGIFWKTFDRAANDWSRRDPERIREQGYETLTEQPVDEIRSLLEICGLSFDPACLTFHESQRNVHTLSAAQVRQPMRRHAGTAAAYGAILDPLRLAVGMAPLAQSGNVIAS